MKKLIAMLMAAMMVLSLAACGGSDAPAENNAPAAPVAESAVEILETVWAAYGEDEKFFAMGGGLEAPVENAPGAFPLEDTETLAYMLYLPAEQAALVDDCASLIHAMNTNTFTGASFHVADAANVQAVVDALKDNIMNAQWMCGFPEKLVIAVVGGDYVVSAFGNGELIAAFQAKLTEQYGDAVVISVEENLI